MKRFAAIRPFLTRNFWLAAAIGIGLALLYTYKLGNLTDGLAAPEVQTADKPVGWHGLYADPFYLPLGLLRSVVFLLQPDHGQILTRLSNVPFGLVAIAAFYLLIRWWYGARIAALSGVMFASSAWALHVSRIATVDVLYFAAIPLLLLSIVLLKKYYDLATVFLGSVLLWMLLLYVPGLLYLVLGTALLQRKYIREAWKDLGLLPRLTSITIVVIGILPLIRHLLRPHTLMTWLGLPDQWPTLMHLGKQFAGVPVHLFIRGPEYPHLWLGKAPVFDIFTLVLALLGIYFYATHLSAFRSRLLLGAFVISIILVGLGGAVGFSLLVPLMFIFAATGLAYLLREWLQTFPANPVARTVGVGLIVIAVSLSCLYNLRAYFIAWPHAPATKVAFRYHR